MLKLTAISAFAAMLMAASAAAHNGAWARSVDVILVEGRARGFHHGGPFGDFGGNVFAEFVRGA